MEPITQGIGRQKDPFWYKDALIYELHVRSFFDSNADGIGDFPGLIQKLDYLADLGVTALWLLPFYPSPLRDGGYDIADYFSIDPAYGTMKDWRVFLRQAHERGLRVITELVLNHTSDQHAWFQRSRRAPKHSAYRDFYVWTDNPQKYKHARIIFKDFELSNWTWDPIAQAYYWHRFYAHQPDLNFDHPEVHKAIFRVIDFWLEQGVDGFRLDAIPYLYERENTSCEGLPETHQFLKDLRRHVDCQYEDRMLLAEANQWPEEAVTYFGAGEGDECHMAFHFPLMPRLFMGVRMEDRVPIIDILEQTPPLPATSQWALFLRNHDELTLEMVTDEERDYMYRVYAEDAKARVNLGIRRRLAPLLGNDRKKIELLNFLLFSMPGTPVIYYGDEIGMGDNIYLGDRNGVRTPMHWSSDKNAGFSRASPQALPLPVIVDPEFHFEAINTEAQQRNPNSLLWWTKRLINLRKQFKAFGRGSLHIVPTDNRKVLAFVRQYDSENILVVANLSRVPQPCKLDLSAFSGQSLIEFFGHTEFPPATADPYFLTLAPYAGFWFYFKPVQKEAPELVGATLPKFVVEETWRKVLFQPARERVPMLRNFMEKQPWYFGKGRAVSDIQVQDLIDLEGTDQSACLAMLKIEYLHGDPERYMLPLAFATGEAGAAMLLEHPDLILAMVRVNSRSGEGRPLEGVLFDAVASPEVGRSLLQAIGRRRVLKGDNGDCHSWQIDRLGVVAAHEPIKRVMVIRSNSSLILQDRFFLKLFRRIEPGINPEFEVSRHLTHHHFRNTPPVIGGLEYRSENNEVISIGLLSQIVPEAKSAWIYTLESLGRYFDKVQTLPPETLESMQSRKSILSLAERDVPTAVVEAIGAYLDNARLLGQRVSEMHLALTDSHQLDFQPEPYTPFYLRSLYQSMRNRVNEGFDLLRAFLPNLETEEQSEAEALLDSKAQLLQRLQGLFRSGLQGFRIRIHCNLSLGDVLFTGKDFYIVDFEGDPARSLTERRIKRPPSHDLATMIHSFHDAAHSAVEQHSFSGALSPDQSRLLKPWAEVWWEWAAVCFLKGYFEGPAARDLISPVKAHRDTMISCQIADKAMQNLIASLRHRPDWSWVSVHALLEFLERWPSAS